MGTNYYATCNRCPHCGRTDDRLHIGKSSAGWTFTFQAVPAGESWDGKRIASYGRWLEVLAQPGVEIRDQHGKACSLEDFKRMVDRKKDGKKHAEAMAAFKSEHCLDDDGHSFSVREFS